MKPFKAWAIKDKSGAMEIYTDITLAVAEHWASQRWDPCVVVRVEIREVAPKPRKTR